MNKINYGSFCEALREAVQSIAGEDVHISIVSVPKINQPDIKGLMFSDKKKRSAPILYPETQYEEYQAGKKINEIAQEAVEFYRENYAEKNINLDFLADYSKARNNVVCRIVNFELNRKLLDGAVYTPFLDLAIVYYYEMGKDFEEGRRCSFMIRNKHVATWNITKEQLHFDAIGNTKKKYPVEINDMGKYINEIMELAGICIPGIVEKKSNLYVVSNSINMFASINICFPDVLRDISEKMGGDYFVIPSSIHELIVMRVDENSRNGKEFLHRTAKMINAEEVEPEEVLGDTIYRYYADRHELCICE